VLGLTGPYDARVKDFSSFEVSGLLFDRFIRLSKPNQECNNNTCGVVDGHGFATSQQKEVGGVAQSLWLEITQVDR